MRDPDCAVIGASFAGLACARAAAARGLRVLVCERKPEPGAGVRTTGLLVKEAAEEWDVPPHLTREIPGVRLYGPSLRAVDLTAPGYYFLATDTPALLRWLAAEAAARGADLRFATPFGGATRDGDRIALAAPAVRVRQLVGADGPMSAVARAFGLGRNRRFLVGVEWELAGVRGVAPDRLHCFLDPRLAPGYLAWVVPGCGVTQIGLACRAPARPDLPALLARLRGLFDLDRARVLGRRAGLIPVGGPVRPAGAPGVLLVGDAAGHVSPLTAGGIHPALRLGRLAGIAIADHLRSGGSDPATVCAAAAPAHRVKRLLRRALEVGPPAALLDLALRTGPLRALAQIVFFHHRGLLAPVAWRDAAKALFGYARSGISTSIRPS